MTARLKALLIALAVLGTAAIAINVYFYFFKPAEKTVTAIDMATREVKHLTPKEARAIRDEVMGKIEESRRKEQERQLEAERKGEKRE
jgi:hypothetical protein